MMEYLDLGSVFLSLYKKILVFKINYYHYYYLAWTFEAEVAITATWTFETAVAVTTAWAFES